MLCLDWASFHLLLEREGIAHKNGTQRTRKHPDGKEKSEYSLSVFAQVSLVKKEIHSALSRNA